MTPLLTDEQVAAPLLDIRDLHVTYRTARGDVPAVRGVDLTVCAGESVGVAGESGCGKSTLAATVLRLQPRNATVRGTVQVRGQDVMTMRWGRLRALRWAEASIVFQGALHSLNPVQRIGDQLVEPMLLHDRNLDRQSARRRSEELLELVGLPAARAQGYPHQLSGGQRQRVMIAMALACDPQLIVADEPTTALDVMVQAQVLSLLTGIVQRLGIGLLLISHDLSVLGTTCDRAVVMYAGRIVEEGAAGQLFDAPLHPYTRALSRAFPRVGDATSRYAPAGLPGDPPDPARLGPGCSFAPRCPMAERACTDSEPELRSMEPGREAACSRLGVVVS